MNEQLMAMVVAITGDQSVQSQKINILSYASYLDYIKTANVFVLQSLSCAVICKISQVASNGKVVK